MKKQKQILIQDNKIEEKTGEIQKIWQNAKIKSDAKSLAIFLGLFSLAVGGRVALQYVPSVEPIIPIAILAGLLFGMKEGAGLGAGAFVASNFFIWGLQGPWTIFQALGAGIPGCLAGAYGKIKKPKTRDLVLLSLAGTIIFEITMNISGAAMGIGVLGAFSLFTLPLYFVTSAPFSIVHVLSNLVFARALAPLLKLRRQDNEFQVVSISRHSPAGTSTLRVYKHRAD
ncbi:MAG: ECF transporter S component [Candidatus ainarchaeum sp.]|nr:ECF transporter S component [Candidatus ainarchaeum sp.]